MRLQEAEKNNLRAKSKKNKWASKTKKISLRKTQKHVKTQWKLKLVWMGHSVELFKFWLNFSGVNRPFRIDLNRSRRLKHGLLIDFGGFFLISLIDYFFSLLEPHSELQRTWLYRKFRKSNLYFFYVKVMKRSHFFLSKISFSGFCPYFHGRAHQGNFFFPIFGVPLLTNGINQKLPWTGPKKCNTK